MLWPAPTPSREKKEKKRKKKKGDGSVLPMQKVIFLGVQGRGL
jgi:hypothetical protein